jgi:glutamate-1-semialdehyde 2,1-aminomutase
MAVDLSTLTPKASADVAERLVAAYRAQTARSAELAAAARRVMPGGDTRTVAFHAPYPLTIERAQGCRLIDADGNEYIDILNNYTSLIHGHAHPAIQAAVAEQMPKGTNYATAIESQTRLAEIICSRVASVDMVRFTNSGTEATMNAIRAARAFTGRDLIVKIEGGYHGTYDDFEVSVHPDLGLAGPAEAPISTLDTRGVPRNTLDNVIAMPFNDVEAAARIIGAGGEQIAAVIVEPVMGSGGMIPAEQPFLEALRRLTAAHGSLLVFDEVMSFRLEVGGIQEYYGVGPDLTSFAKIIGGGFPVGAFGGRSEIMQMFDPNQPNPLWQSGTFNGNAITMVAGIAAMEHYPASEVARINELGNRFRAGANAVVAKAGLPGQAIGYGSFSAIHFVDGAVRNYRDAAAGDAGFKRLVHIALLLEGVFCAPRLMFCTSTAMDEAVVDEVVGRLERAIRRVLVA